MRALVFGPAGLGHGSILGPDDRTKPAVPFLNKASSCLQCWNTDLHGHHRLVVPASQPTSSVSQALGTDSI